MKVATLEFSIGIEGEDFPEMGDDAIKEMLLEILADQSDEDLLPLITVEGES